MRAGSLPTLLFASTLLACAWGCTGSTGGGGLVAEISSSDATGIAPLRVHFESTSQNAESVRWDFGDGSSSTKAALDHVFLEPGDYAVRLTAIRGDQQVISAVTSIRVEAAVLDAGFESLAAGAEPAGAWKVFGNGEAHQVVDKSSGAEVGWPREGDQWVELSTDGTDAAIPPSDPHDVTTPAVGGSGILQEILYSPERPVLQLDVAFVSGEGFANAAQNDWMSVDLEIAGVTHNLYLRDTFAAAGPSSRHPGALVTASESITFDVGEFQALENGAELTLSVQVGNGGTATGESFGYVDRVRFEARPGTVLDSEFSATPALGDAPLSAQFTDLSSGAPSEWSWDFGDGEGATAQDPTHVYATPGSYDVCLFVSKDGSSDREIRAGLVVVGYPDRVAEFSGSPTSGPIPLAVQFTNLSSNATSWLWDFGDGTAKSTQQAPLHAYTAPGFFTVSLTATGPDDEDFVIKPDYIRAYAVPVAQFTGTPTSGVAPLAVVFSNTSLNSTSWLWNFGDGTTSSINNPTHVYANAGTFTVTLTAFGGGGLSDQLIRPNYITAHAVPVADFFGAPLAGAPPLAVTFTNQSQNTTSWSWDFGDGAVSTLQHPAHTYTAQGTYGVRLTATGPGGSDVDFKPSYIQVSNAPIADFSASPTQGAPPLQAQFTNQSQNASSYLWDFGDGSNTSTLVNPSHTYSAAGSYTVTLTAFGIGSPSTKVRPNYIVVVPNPVANFFGSPLSGGAPLSVSFTNQSQNATSYAWTFGDGKSSAATNPTNLYQSPGTYTVTLVAQNSIGAMDTDTKVNYVTVHSAPNITIFPSTTLTNVGTSVSFNATNTGGPITTWSWTFGDGGSSNSANNTSHPYSSWGTYAVNLAVTGPGGADSAGATVKVAKPWSLLFPSVYPISTCNGCHNWYNSGDTTPAQTQVWNSLVNQSSSAGCTPTLKVAPGNATNSTLPFALSTAPPSCFTMTPFPNGELQNLIDWINAGAINN